MSVTMKELGIDRMSAEERIALASEIWNSLDDSNYGENISEEVVAELERRDAEMDHSSQQSLTWEAIRSDIESRRA